MPSLENISLFIPEIEEHISKDMIYDVKFMPDRQDFNYYPVIKKHLKVDFIKDNSIELVLPIPFDIGLIIQDGISHKYKFDALREGYITVFMKIQIQEVSDSTGKKLVAYMNPELKTVKLYNTDGDEMKNEAKLIYAFVQNQVVSQKYMLNKTFDL